MNSSSNKPSTPGNSEHTLLLVEDNQDDEALSLRAVKKSGIPCDVVVLRSGSAAMSAMLGPDAPTPELILLDFHLPKYNGIEILRELRKQERFRNVPIVMFSSLETDEDFSKCLVAGANSVVTKPDEPAAYVEKVSLLVRYWLTVHQNIARHVSPKEGYAHIPSGIDRPKVHIIKEALVETDEQRFSSTLPTEGEK